MSRDSRLAVLPLFLALCIASALFLAPGGPLTAGQPSSTGGPAAPRSGDASEFVRGEIIVKLGAAAAERARGRLDAGLRVTNARTGVFSLDSLNGKYRVREMRSLMLRPEQARSPFRQSALVDYFLVRLGSEGSEEAAVAEYRRDPSVMAAQLNYTYVPDAVPNDPRYSEQYAHPKTHAPEGWDITTGSSAITIAIIGEGTQLDHEDLAANIGPGFDFIDNDSDPNTGPGEGHETSVSGVAAAVTNNSLGIAGVCWSCRIMPLRVDYESGDVAQAIDFASANFARVVNMSFSSTVPNKYGPDGIVADAVTNAYNNGLVLVATAGNTNANEMRWPGALERVIDVSATTAADQRSSFSTWGYWVDVAAPGTAILSTVVPFTDPETNQIVKYRTVSGTSFSAPYIAGVAGLILSRNPGLLPATVAQIIEYSSDPIVTDHFIGTGRVNVQAALALNAPPTLAAVIKAPENNLLINSSSVSVFGTAIGTGYLLEYRVGSSGTWTQFGSGPQKLNDTLGTLGIGGIPVGTQIGIRLTSSSGAGQKQSQVSVIAAGTSGWRQSFEPNNGASPVYADLDGDGKPEIVTAGSDGGVWVWKQNGTLLPGWPKFVDVSAIYGSPAVGDVDGDGFPDVVVAHSFPALVGAWHANGQIVMGFPKSIGDGSGNDSIRGGVTLANLDADAALEILATTINGTVSVIKGQNAAYLAPWPLTLESNLQTTAVVGDVTGDGQVEVIIRGYNNLYVFRPDGALLPGFPRALEIGHTPPGLGDVNHDGKFDMVTTGDATVGIGGVVTAIDGTGNQILRTQLPVRLGTLAVALGDPLRDGSLQIFAGQETGQVYGFSSQGVVLPGWPVTTGANVSGAPIIVDIDGDGQAEIVAGSQDGSLYAWNADGSRAFDPIPLGSTIFASPAAGDLDLDGDVDLLVHDLSGSLTVIDFNGAWNARRADWPMYQANARHAAVSDPDADDDGDPNRLDCGPTDPAIRHGATEICNLKDDDCDGLTDEGFDADGDGFTACGGDCNDLVWQIHPGAPEVCDNYDDDCDGLVDEGLDADGDGYTPCQVPVPDCNDANPAIHPGATELCNAKDDDCDNQIDEDFDGDHDGWTQCSPACASITFCDCADNDTRINGIESPSTYSSCFDQLDNDCDGVKDWDCAIDVGTESIQTGSVSPKQPGGLNNMKAASLDDTYETLTEGSSGGAKKLSVFWTFPSQGGAWWDLRVEGNRLATTGDLFTFSFAQLKQGETCPALAASRYTTGPTISKTTDDDRLQFSQVGPAAFDTVAFCVKAADSITSGDTTANKLQVDKLYLMPILLDAKATGAIPGEGTTQGTFVDTQAVGGGTQTLTEGGPNSRLIYTYVFDTVPVGFSHYLYFEAWRPNNTDLDDFKFQWAPPDANGNPGTFTDIPGAVVNQARFNGGITSGTFGPAGLVNKVFIRVVDTAGGTNLDKVTIDYLAIRTSP
jgi:hypothetical protein